MVLSLIVLAPAKWSAKLLVIAGDQFGFYKMICSKVKLFITDKLLLSWNADSFRLIGTQGLGRGVNFSSVLRRPVSYCSWNSR